MRPINKIIEVVVDEDSFNLKLPEEVVFLCEFENVLMGYVDEGERLSRIRRDGDLMLFLSHDVGRIREEGAEVGVRDGGS